MSSLKTIFTRIQLWETALYSLSTNPQYFVFGAAQQKVLSLSTYFTYGRFSYPNSHNAILNQAVYYGVPILLVYLALIVKSTRLLNFAINTPNTLANCNKGFSYFLLITIFSILGAYMLEPASEGVLQQAQFFMLVGLALALSDTNFVSGASSHGE